MDEVSFTTHWSRIFDLVAPKLIGWCSTYNATQGVVTLLADEVSRQAAEARELKTYRLSAGSLTTIRNQLLALDLIHVETEQRGSEVGGRTMFLHAVELWRLSERGLREHSQKHALRI